MKRTPKVIWRVYNRFGISWDPVDTTTLKNCKTAAIWDEKFPNAAPHRVVKYVASTVG